jgi:hypothetical protein
VRRLAFHQDAIDIEILLHHAPGGEALLEASAHAWAIRLWQSGAVTTGQVVLVCTLGFGILHAMRDLAVALVDVTQHLARLSEAVATLLVPHELRDAEATAMTQERSHVAFDGVSFQYPDGRKVVERFSLEVAAGERVGLVGEFGSGKSPADPTRDDPPLGRAPAYFLSGSSPSLTLAFSETSLRPAPLASSSISAAKSQSV